MHVFIAFVIGITLLTGIIPEKKPGKDEFVITAGIDGRDKIITRVEPASSLIRKNIISQQYDYSCGSAALSTLLKFGFGEELTERQVILGMLQHGNTEGIKKRRAFSLLDMKKFVTALGYKGSGFRAGIDDLRTLGKPCIVPVSFYNYRHFIIVKGVHKGRVFVADPMQGNISFMEEDFKKLWYENILFLVQNDGTQDFMALKLKDDDLRIIDEKMTRELILEFPQKYTVTEEHRISDKSYYRH